MLENIVYVKTLCTTTTFQHLLSYPTASYDQKRIHS